MGTILGGTMIERCLQVSNMLDGMADESGGSIENLKTFYNLGNSRIEYEILR